MVIIQELLEIHFHLEICTCRLRELNLQYHRHRHVLQALSYRLNPEISYDILGNLTVLK